jgi:arylsulfatase A-like enzyme
VTPPSDARAGDAPAGSAIRWGFVVAAAIDAALAAALVPPSPGGPSTRLIALAFAAGHVLALGLVVAAIVDAGSRLLRARALAPAARRAAAAAAAFVVAFAAGFGVYVEDFSVFPVVTRVALTAAAALPYAGLAAAWPSASSKRPLAIMALSIALGAAVANHLVLDASYPGIHLATHVAVGLLAGLGLAGLARRRLSGRRLAGRLSRARVVAAAAVALAAAASLVVWPSNSVLVALSRDPTAALVPFLARLHDGSGAAAAAAPAGQRGWFVDRRDAPPVAPSSPPLLNEAPIVVFVTVDALRADLLTRDEPEVARSTKNLRALARRGATFRDARSPASSTLPATAAMFTGRYYSSLFWSEKELDGKMKVFLHEEPAPRFAELLRTAGVTTSMVVTTDGFLPEYGVTRGFEPRGRMTGAADRVVKSFIAWLGERGDEPAIIWAHLLDAHAPYRRGAKGAPAFSRYLAEVAFVDQQIGKLAEAIAESPLEERIVLVVSADHGEAFGEHGTRYHASTIYEELVRVPLVVVGAGVRPRAIDEPVSLIDLGPTMLDLFGRPTPGAMMGQSLVPLLRGDDVELSRPIALDAGRRKQALIARDGIKAMRDVRKGTTEVYDLRADPGETVNLVDTRPELATERLATLRAFFGVHQLARPGYQIPYRE